MLVGERIIEYGYNILVTSIKFRAARTSIRAPPRRRISCFILPPVSYTTRLTVPLSVSNGFLIIIFGGLLSAPNAQEEQTLPTET